MDLRQVTPDSLHYFTSMLKATAKFHIRKGKHVRTITDIHPASSVISSSFAATSQLSRPKMHSAKKKKSNPEKNKAVKRASPLTLEDDVNRNEPSYFEHRTVNSMEDMLEPMNYEITSEVSRKRRRRRKIEPIDSEVEVFKTLERQTNLLPRNDSVPSNTLPQIANIRDTMMRKDNVIDVHRLTIEQDKIKKIKNKMASPPPPPASSPPPQTQSNTKKPPVKAIEMKQEPTDKYPVLKNQELVKKFLSVTMTNNQKGRIRQVIRDLVKGTSSVLLPEVINNRIQAILKASENLTDSDLRKIRILHNMLKTAITQQKQITEQAQEKKSEEKQEKSEGKIKKEKKIVKNKKPKRFVVFVGNLPLQVTKEQILAHFCNIRECIKDVRIPPRPEGKKSSFAYLELENEPSYQLALSQHHTMLGRRRINVLYTTNKKGKMTKAEAKAKGAKLTAMAKKGQLIGSVALNKKRSQRRAKMRRAMRDAENAHQAQQFTRTR